MQYNLLLLVALPLAASAQLQSFSPSTDAQGNTVQPCFSTTDGFRMNGEIWKTFSNDWQVQCDNGTIRIIGCIASARANYAVIPIGETLTVNNFWHKCEYVEDKQNVRYEEEVSCPLSGRELKVGDTIRNGLFEMRCLENQWDIVGCYYYTPQGEAKLIKLGETAQSGQFLHKCEKMPNSTSVMYSYEATACVYNGTTYQKGQTWMNGKIKFECMEKGAYEGVACLTDEGVELKVGEDKVVEDDKGKKKLQRCFRNGRSIVYQVYPCGEGAGLKSCSPPDSQPAQPIALMSPGVGSSQPSPLAVAPHGVNSAGPNGSPRSMISSAVLSTGNQFPAANPQPTMQHVHRESKTCTETSLPTAIVQTPAK